MSFSSDDFKNVRSLLQLTTALTLSEPWKYTKASSMLIFRTQLTKASLSLNFDRLINRVTFSFSISATFCIGSLPRALDNEWRLSLKYELTCWSCGTNSTSIAYVLGSSFKLDNVDFDDNKELLTILVYIIVAIIHNVAL